MKRFITYLYAYRDGQKIKNTGHIRVDVRGQMLDMRISITDAGLDDRKGIFYIVSGKDEPDAVSLGEILMKNGQYNGRIVCDCNEVENFSFRFEDMIGVCICYKDGGYLASCWQDGAEVVIADGGFLKAVELEAGDHYEKIEETQIQEIEEIEIEEIKEIEEKTEINETKTMELNVSSEERGLKNEAEIEFQIGPCYRKINLNEIYMLPSSYWHFSNNSFLLHGFWNYGYLVLKEDVTENKKKIALGVPGVFEQPEMVMASYFSFPRFEAMPSEIAAMEIGETYLCECEEKKQPPQAGTFGCWFTNL